MLEEIILYLCFMTMGFSSANMAKAESFFASVLHVALFTVGAISAVRMIMELSK